MKSFVELGWDVKLCEQLLKFPEDLTEESGDEIGSEASPKNKKNTKHIKEEDSI